MLKAKSSSARDVQEKLGFSSPALAQHHLEKLRKYNLVTKDYDGTYRVRSSSFGILKLYIRTGKWIIPRTFFFIAIFAVLAASFLPISSQNTYYLLVGIISLIGLAVAIFETVRSYRVLPPT